MCGRTSLFVPESELEERFGAAAAEPIPPRYNVAPRDEIPAILNERPDAIVQPTWGLVPEWADDPAGSRPINARAETVDETPAFRDAFAERRCLVLADGYYEWTDSRGGKQPYRITREDGRPFAVAGLWARRDDRATVAVVTTEPNDLVEPIHDRAPAVLSPGEEETWLHGDESERLKRVLAPWDPDGWRAYPVSSAVNDPHTDSPELVEEVDAADDGQRRLDDFEFTD